MLLWRPPFSITSSFYLVYLLNRCNQSRTPLLSANPNCPAQTPRRFRHSLLHGDVYSAMNRSGKDEDENEDVGSEITSSFKNRINKPSKIREDTETLEFCREMYSRGECPPLVVVFDACEGYAVQADVPIKDMTFITEYTGDVDYLKNREQDDCDSLMTLLLATEPSKSLVICPDKRGNIARFINGINNHTQEGRKKKNLKCVRYNVNGECRVILVATRDISKGERLYYDYNGYEHEYPTHHNFV